MTAWVKGHATDAGRAVEAAAILLSGARTPVVAGLCAEVSAIQAAYRLAGLVGASLDTAGAARTYAELGALSRVGAMTAPPAEIAGRADLVLLVGAAATSSPMSAPIRARLSAAGPSRGRAAGSDRTILTLGGPGADAAALACPAPEGLPAALGLLRAHVRGHLSGGIEGEIVQRLAGAAYAALIYDAAEIGEVGVEILQGLVMDLNDRTRCVCLALSGDDQDRAAVQVAAWTTGQPPRTGFGRRIPEHDPWRFDAARQVAAGEADAALWLASLPAPRPDWLGRLPAVALLGPDAAAADAAEIVFTVARPGAGTGGVTWNEARAALTYGPATAQGGEPTAADILARLIARLEATTGSTVAAC